MSLRPLRVFSHPHRSVTYIVARSYAVKAPAPYNPNRSVAPSADYRASTRPQIDPLLPPGFTFYENHNDYPVINVPEPKRMYQSELFPPQLPRTSVFHYLFPPKRKGKHFRYYPQNDPRCIAFIDALTGRELYRDEIPVRAMWLNSGLRRLGLKKGMVICIFGSNSLEWVEACYASQAADLIVSPANYG